jgi:hypothetical protein
VRSSRQSSRPRFATRIPQTCGLEKNGWQETLWDASDHYNKGDGLQNPYLDEDIQPLALTEADIDDLGCVARVIDERGLQGTRDKGAGATTRALPDEAATARHGEGLRPESATAQTSPPLIRTLDHFRRSKMTPPWHLHPSDGQP